MSNGKKPYPDIPNLESLSEKVRTWLKQKPNLYFVFEDLNDRGFDLRIYGGFVRDVALGESPKDYDFETNASIDLVRELFIKYKLLKTDQNLNCIIPGKAIFSTRIQDQDEKEMEIDIVGQINLIGNECSFNHLRYDFREDRVLNLWEGLSDLQNRVLTIPSICSIDIPAIFRLVLNYSKYNKTYGDFSIEKATLSRISVYLAQSSDVFSNYLKSSENWRLLRLLYDSFCLSPSLTVEAFDILGLDSFVFPGVKKAFGTEFDECFRELEINNFPEKRLEELVNFLRTKRSNFTNRFGEIRIPENNWNTFRPDFQAFLKKIFSMKYSVVTSGGFSKTGIRQSAQFETASVLSKNTTSLFSHIKAATIGRIPYLGTETTD